MIFSTTVSKFCQLSFSSKSYISFDQNNIQFSTIPQKTDNGKYKFQIHDCHGKFEIRYVYSKGLNQYIPYDKASKTFVVKKCSNKSFEFTIIADIKFYEIDSSPLNHNVLYIPFSQTKEMEPLSFYKDKFSVSVNGEFITLNYYVKKIKNDVVQVIVENAFDGLKINNQEGNFEFTSAEAYDIKQTLSYTFDSSDFEKLKQLKEKSDPILTKNSLSILQTSSTTKDNSKWHEIMSNPQYSDVFLLSSDNIKISSHRCILAKYSKIFVKIFETSEIPVTINVENFNAETIKAALGFLYDKSDSILGKEMDVYKFAVNFDIQDLIDACCSIFVESVNAENVCEYIQIGYSKNFDELKQKCKQIMIENKREIDQTKLKLIKQSSKLYQKISSLMFFVFK
uniref:BTB domain-containing protein n=1 Tax=Panagrolaimus davidi TaxID=227884 RepID=A0A914PV29_9BILA